MDGDGDNDGRADVLAASAEAEISGAVVPSADVDLLSGLPDNLLVRILLCLHHLHFHGNPADYAEAARTCVLSRRWRDLWVQIPVLVFYCFNPDGCARVHAALACPRPRRRCPGHHETPRAFNALTALHLKRIRIDGQLILGDSMFPSLHNVLIDNTLGLVDLALSSRSLVWLKLSHLRGLQRINVEAHSLEWLCVIHCLRYNLQVASFSMEGLKVLRWTDRFDPILVNLSEMPHLRQLSITHFIPYGWAGHNPNQDCLRIINHFSTIHHLELVVSIESDLSGTESKLECITSLPNIEILSLVLSSHGHVIGASVLYLLRMCTGIRELSLKLPENSEVLNTCPLNCICDQQPNWRAEHILMKFLREAEILNFRGEDHELDLVKLLLRAAPGLRRLRITCHRSFAAWERLSEDLQSLASQETCVEVSQVMTPPQP
ncbi:hypothetical protein GUJ93_ZPchr0007g3520 [Zizania palustris]|uniref:F-box domain-containing protein n=1 Tax=Zizania palustris TaxID=103762 RepID=A0A8J5TE94_ZIZPA|nr:hypothetical protein GUJ93_ZPchr0007g3520 [Zizania palustris]